ncbi:MAG: hypothetical protein R3F38_16495 [Gammaproteobacteria bacterium]
MIEALGAHRNNVRWKSKKRITEVLSIEEVAVLGVPDELLGQTIAAFVVMKPGEELDVKQIKKHCLVNLMSHKIPKQTLKADVLPKTASGI